MSSELLLFAAPNQLNDATRWYLDTVARAAQALGLKLRHVTRLSEIGPAANVLVVEYKSACKLALARPQARVWLWIQGVFPEEARLHFDSRAREGLWRAFECLALPRVRGALVVSEAMRLHFTNRYPRLRLPMFTMPCVNAALNEAAFRRPGKYAAPRFVYAGSLHAWQCVEESLASFARIRAARPAARLSIFTQDTVAAANLVGAAGLRDVEVAHLTLPALNARLDDFKYGFVLRREHIVNRVATPTKVSTYMAHGVIPVMTRAVQDYNFHLGALDPIVLSPSIDAATIADAVLAMEQRTLDAEQVLTHYRHPFEHYFNHDAYLPKLQRFLQATGMTR